MKYAVIQFQGKQYRVEEGMELTLDRVAEDEKKSLTLKDVLLFVDGDVVKIGAPYVDGATVKATVLSHGRGVKIRVATFKAKSKERKTIGHRQAETVLKIDTISAK